MTLGVPCSSVVDVQVDFDARHRCPFVNEDDRGTVRVAWSTAFGETLELHALAILISAREDEKISHEQWTFDLAGAISKSACVAGLHVTSRWVTAGGVIVVTVPAGPVGSTGQAEIPDLS